MLGWDGPCSSLAWLSSREGLGGVGWAGMCIGPLHLPLLVAGTVCCPSFGCMLKDLAPSPALMVLGTAQHCQPSRVLSAQILGSQEFSITEAFGGVLSHLCWAAVSACWRRRPLGQQQILLPTFGVCTFRCSRVFIAFLCLRTRGLTLPVSISPGIAFLC